MNMQKTMYSGEEAHHSTRNPKHPRLSSRLQRDHTNGDPRSKQPRPLEDGNWVCEDPDCSNVNYPRRVECNKCGRRRGQLGDAVVRAYLDSMKIARGDMHAPAMASALVGERMCMAHGMLPLNGAEIAHPGLLSSGPLDRWMGRGYEQFSPYVAEGGGFTGRGSALRVAKEGKRLVEQLVATFAASPDPLGDANDCLSSAQIWLQTMKSRMQAGDSIPMNSGASPPLAHIHMPLAGMNGIDYSRGRYLSRGNAPGAPKLRYEDYKDRPSDFLREFGDPAAVSASSMGGSLKPEPGVNGNWECEECKNVNFPRRTSCFQCHKKRGPKGDDIVGDYVQRLIDRRIEHL